VYCLFDLSMGSTPRCGALAMFPASTPGKFNIARLAFLAWAFTYLYLTEFFLPHTPILRVGDHSVYLLNAMRMLEGQVIYRDFFQFTLPGTELTYVTLFKVFGRWVGVPNAALISLGLGLTWVTTSISARVMKGWNVFLPGLLFLPALVYESDATHHWFSTLAVMLAVAAVIEKRSRARLVVAGALCGLALFFTQVRGVAGLLGFAVFLLWERQGKRESWNSLLGKEAWLFTSFAATAVGCSWYFLWKAGLRRFFYCTVVFGLKYHSSAWYNTWRFYMVELPRPHWGPDLAWLGSFLLIYGSIPLVFVVFFVREGREAAANPQEPWDRLMLLSIMGFTLFLGVAPAPSHLRFCSVFPAALIMLVWLITRPGMIERLGLCLLWIAAALWMLAKPVRMQTHWRAYLDLPSGRTAFLDPPFRDRYQWFAAHTRPSEFFFDAEWPNLYFPLYLRDPARVPFLTPTNYTRPEQVQEVIESLEAHPVRYVLWTTSLDIPDDSNPAADHLASLRAYLRTYYHPVKTFGTEDEVWEKRRRWAGISPVLGGCDGRH